ncbi:hypothetical protein EVAR_59538_1 [Eumeta japonica]|uniref:Uncharacterized protein n=1 Tax=Eumeta variegata TaxID=151549 RepID=A0A4C1T9C4_EUMVA|nr:hypothetical protein EVAR_59538_1 [Eumeta japonica]
MNRRYEIIVQWFRESSNEGKQLGDSKPDSEAGERSLAILKPHRISHVVGLKARALKIEDPTKDCGRDNFSEQSESDVAGVA